MRIRKKLIFQLFGPAWIVMMADMDASSTIGAAETGALFNYSMIWFLLLLIIPLFIMQEVSGRLGVATEKGLGENIRERYSRKLALLLTLPMALADIATYAIEYLGIAVGLSVLGISPILSVPIVFVIHITIVARGKYKNAEKVLILISGVLIMSFILALLVRGVHDYSLFSVNPTTAYLFILAANAGAVIMPFMLFFQASATAHKMKSVADNITSVRGHMDGSHLKHIAIRLMRFETLLGAIATEIMMIVVEMVMAGNIPIAKIVSAKSISASLSIIAGPYAPLLFGVGLAASGFLALVVISLGSAWGTAEAIGISRDRIFYFYLLESIPGAAAAMILPGSMLINAVLDLLVGFVFILLGPGLILGYMAGKKEIMGPFISGQKLKSAYWFSLAFIFMLGIVAVIS